MKMLMVMITSEVSGNANHDPDKLYITNVFTVCLRRGNTLFLLSNRDPDSCNDVIRLL